MESPINEENLEKKGVQDVKIENNHYVVSIIGKDGKKYDRVFPENGFPVVDPETQHQLAYISGPHALKILEDHSAEYTADDFSWIPFVK